MKFMQAIAEKCCATGNKSTKIDEMVKILRRFDYEAAGAWSIFAEWHRNH